MYEIDKTPNSDEAICENCGMIIDKKRLGITADFDNGCSECMSPCKWCGKYHFNQDMYSSPWFGKICNECVSDYGYKKVVRNKVIKEALRCYFDTLDHKAINQLTIEVARFEGFTELAQEMRNDL